MTMRHSEREVTDPALIACMMDLFDIVHVGFRGEQAPYVVPMNFGFEAKPDCLCIYVHCARAGHKLDLLAKEPHVCAEFSRFENYPACPVLGHLHDYRSVIAFGVMSKITEPNLHWAALQALLAHNGRGQNQFDADRLRMMDMYVITCLWKDVTGKSEIPVAVPGDVPFRCSPQAEP